VVHDADGAVPDDVMLAFARETKLSETSFVQPAAAQGADYRNRIWMMTGEIPFAGHPSLGVAVAVARARGMREGTLVQQTQPGLQPIDVQLDGATAKASMLQEPPSFGPELDTGETLRLVGLTAADADPRLPVQLVSTGVPQLMAPVRDTDVLARAAPDYEAIGALLDAHGAIVYYLVAVDADTGSVRARSFMSTAEKGEDPATGSAAGPLCAHVNAHLGIDAIEIDQGSEMGRPSRLRAAVEGDRVRVEGDAVVVIDGTVRLDF
jgi:trans-2,3-dihydro-3-hydroxyanthranilate isomerase